MIHLDDPRSIPPKWKQFIVMILSSLFLIYFWNRNTSTEMEYLLNSINKWTSSIIFTNRNTNLNLLPNYVKTSGYFSRVVTHGNTSPVNSYICQWGWIWETGPLSQSRLYHTKRSGGKRYLRPPYLCSHSTTIGHEH